MYSDIESTEAKKKKKIFFFRFLTAGIKRQISYQKFSPNENHNKEKSMSHTKLDTRFSLPMPVLRY